VKKYTPGPWIVDDSIGYEIETLARHKKEKDLCARIIGSAGWWPEDKYDQTPYNAYLMAAAPELLEALKDLVAEIKRPGGCSQCAPDTDRAEAAIAKAEAVTLDGT